MQIGGAVLPLHMMRLTNMYAVFLLPSKPLVGLQLMIIGIQNVPGQPLNNCIEKLLKASQVSAE
jgi:hypothetical protein